MNTRIQNIDRIKVNMSEGDSIAYHAYLRHLKRTDEDPDWPCLFRYWTKQPCKACNGTGTRRPDQAWMGPVGFPCIECNGIALERWTSVVSYELDFRYVFSMAHNWNKRLLLSPAGNALIVYCWAVAARHGKRIPEHHRAPSTPPVRRHRATMRLVVMVNASIRYTPIGNKISVQLMEAAVLQSLEIGLLEFDRLSQRIYIPRNDRQPEIRSLTKARQWNP